MASKALPLWSSSLVLALALGARAELLPAADARLPLPPLSVSDDAGAPRAIADLAVGKATLLLPIFARCPATCPATADGLKSALAGGKTDFHVVLLSFDPGDKAKDLTEFRKRARLPEDWAVARVPDPAAARDFFDAYGFRYTRSDGGFLHPNETLVLSPKGAWAATLSGTSFSQRELAEAYHLALLADDPSTLGQLRRLLKRPESWAVLGFVGLAASVAAFVLLPRG